MKVKIWGARGSIPAPGPETVKYGGNTSCLQVLSDSGELVIFDAGSGFRKLGDSLLPSMPVTGHIFFSHVHWDHIQGFPFFTPGYVSGNKFILYGQRKFKTSLEETMIGQMQYPTFPVLLEEMAADIKFRDLKEFDKIDINGLAVSCIKGNHPDGVFVYKVEEGGKSLIYATDNEHFTCIHPKFADFIRGADVLIYDTQFTDDEYSGKTGRCRASWGHSTIEEAVKVARATDVGKLVMWHHDPYHDDAKIADMEKWAKERFANTEAAFEGMEIDL